MGLPVRVVLYAAGEAQARTAASAAFARIADLDRMMSAYRSDSELSELQRRSPEWVPVSAELVEVLRRAIEVARATQGAFDPTVGPLVSLWREARSTQRLPDAVSLASARALVGWSRIEFRDPVEPSPRVPVRLGAAGMRLDLGAIAKGYILQDALGVLRVKGIPRALVEAGGDIVAGSAPPGRPGWCIEVPGVDADFRRRAARLTDAALASSGPAAQFVEIDGVRYSHVVDPRTGLGVATGVTAHVMAPDAATADALATALTVLGPERAPPVIARFPGAIAAFRAHDADTILRY
ncbi:MAG TPA: FAD:protein FMN transferase [Vicinamibacterales bacterium]|nr:FAD:protein FMN transferase [Vicinamibacterales bacterium]